MPQRIAVIGGGAAGFFAAIRAKEVNPEAIVTIYEKGEKPLAKVAITGGGRCNLTNSFAQVTDLKKVYPRGDKLMKRLFKTFDHQDTIRWFESHGVPLVTQEDECVFPRSQDAQSIVKCLTNEARRLGISIVTRHNLTGIKREENKTFLLFNDNNKQIEAERVIITTGGHPKHFSFEYLAQLGHEISAPIPSLFTFNINDKALRNLMGTVVENATISVVGEKMRANGPILITHWGLSGPAVLKLSSYAARFSHERQYRFNVSINWIGETNTSIVAELIKNTAEANASKLVTNAQPLLPHIEDKRGFVNSFPRAFPTRLWDYLMQKIGMPTDKRWNETGKKWQNKIVEVLVNDIYHVEGKSSWREEFVTCGGISLNALNPTTLESKHVPGLFFAGEVTDVDAITGGFNLQAAWTMGYVAGENAAH
ncbi:MAG: NAD(P)/FAD-dependent oxidoreductase [Prevotella sp.]|nr:NAD(P)/FAD-dependent oxidoreductase [Prevotella sp.]